MSTSSFVKAFLESILFLLSVYFPPAYFCYHFICVAKSTLWHVRKVTLRNMLEGWGF